ncbi:MAG TPA: hypothetical protein VLE49_20945 [Anaerolineales bacterium]|nr:hypothetical protein [Anaerolineales bacterium]
MNFNFGEVLSRAWQIIWKHKVLWIFGILAGCSRGGSNFNSNSSGRGNGGGFGGGNLPPQLQQLFQTISENMTTFIVIIITLFCILWIVTIFLGTIGRIGLIRGTWQVEGGAEHLVFGQLFSESMPYFWRMFGLSLLVSLPIIILVAVMVVVIIAFAFSASSGNDSAGIGMLGSMGLFLGCLCLLIPVLIVIGIITRQAENAIVLEDAGVLPSLSRGWEVFRNNLGPVIFMAIILGVLGLIVGFVIAIPIFIVVVPAVLTFAAGQAQDWTPLIFMGVCLCLYIPVTWLLNGILVAYTETAWTLTYMRLTKPQSNAPVMFEANA